jgi:hypothetical protein
MQFDAQRFTVSAAVTHDALRSAVDPMREMAVDAPAWQPGEVVSGRYAVAAAVGEGGMGRVYRVRDALHPERDLALKTLSPSWVSAARVALFKAEFRTMAELDHPNIARVHDFETIAGGHAFTMEFVDGRDLLAASDGQPAARIVDWIVEACRALSYLHSRGVIHADFKPHNVLVTAAGAVKVVDFGLSGGIGAGLLLGTPAYMAPELGWGQAADARVDLYALGVTLYHLLFRRVPFGGDSVEAVLRRHAQEPLAFPRETPLNAVIARLCEKQPRDRFATANEVIDALAAATGARYAPETSETRRSYVSGARLVGRDAELQRLMEFCLTRAEGRAADDAVIATLAGPSGVGKSRLMREVRNRLQLGSVPFVEAACYEGSFGELSPLKAWADALAALARAHQLGAVERAHAATLAWLSAGEPRAPRSRFEEESLRMARLRDLADFMVELSESIGFVLYLNDLQWGRTSTTDFLRVLCDRQTARRDRGAACRLALVVSFRDDEVEGRPLAELLGALSAARRASVALAPLAASQTAELIGSLFGAGDVPAAFSARVSDETGGNPFFIEEVLRVLMERGDVYLAAGQWAARPDVARLELPPPIAQVLERRLQAIDARDRELLEWLASYGQPMPLALLAAAAGRALDDAADGARRLAERQLTAIVDGERARPAHDKLREFLYQRLAPDARREKHRAIARALDGLAAGDDDFVFERAHHYWHAGADAEARAWSERAARAGEARFATDVAIDNWERVRTLVGARGDQEARRHATDRLLELCTVVGQYARIVEVSGAEMAHAADEVDRARLLQLQGEALGGQGQLAAAVERLHEAAALCGGPVPRGGRRRKLFVARHYLRQIAALTLRRRLDAPARLAPAERRRREILSWCYFLLSIYAMLTGDDEGVPISIAGYNVARPLGRTEIARRLLQNAALCHHLLGNWRTSERLAAEAQRQAESELDRAQLLPTLVLARQMTQRPIFAGQRPVNSYDDELARAIELLSTRGKLLWAHLARSVLTTSIRHYAPSFQFRPEMFRWAEAMRGTVHYGAVQGGAAVMALVAGQKQRAAEAHADALAGTTTPFYRVWIEANFAYVCALTGDTAQAARSLSAVARGLEAMNPRVALSLWVPTLGVGACLALRARGADEPWLRAALVECVARVDRVGRRVPDNMRLLREAGRAALGRSSLAALERARARSQKNWEVEKGLAGHSDGCLCTALALARSPRAAERAAARAWANEAMALIAPRYPAAFVERVRELLPL